MMFLLIAGSAIGGFIFPPLWILTAILGLIVWWEGDGI